MTKYCAVLAKVFFLQLILLAVVTLMALLGAARGSAGVVMALTLGGSVGWLMGHEHSCDRVRP